MKELKKKIKNGEHVTGSDLCQAIMSDGIENVRFLIPSIYLNSIMYDNFPVEEYTLFKIEERWNRNVNQCYKLILVPAKSNNSVPYYEDFYVTSLLQLIKARKIKIAN